jgi:hypothetical protein
VKPGNGLLIFAISRQFLTDKLTLGQGFEEFSLPPVQFHWRWPIIVHSKEWTHCRSTPDDQNHNDMKLTTFTQREELPIICSIITTFLVSCSVRTY